MKTNIITRWRTILLTIILPALAWGQLVIFEDPVENDGVWINVWGGHYPGMSGEQQMFEGLAPIEGQTFWTATTINPQARGLRTTLIDNFIISGTYHLEFYVGVRGSQYFADRDGVISGLSSDADFAINPNDHTTLLQNLDNNVILAKVSPTPPNEQMSDSGWEKWTITTVVPEDSPVIGTELGILIRFATGSVDSSVHKGAAVDSVRLTHYESISLWPEPLFPLEGELRHTGFGWVYDKAYPFVHAQSLRSWIWIAPGSKPFHTDGWWRGYDLAEERWISSAEAFDGWFWDFNTEAWVNAGARNEK